MASFNWRCAAISRVMIDWVKPRSSLTLASGGPPRPVNGSAPAIRGIARKMETTSQRNKPLRIPRPRLARRFVGARHHDRIEGAKERGVGAAMLRPARRRELLAVLHLHGSRLDELEIDIEFMIEGRDFERVLRRRGLGMKRHGEE